MKDFTMRIHLCNATPQQERECEFFCDCASSGRCLHKTKIKVQHDVLCVGSSMMNVCLKDIYQIRRPARWF